MARVAYAAPMFRVLVIAGALAAGALTGACRDPQLEQLEAIRDEICACKTSACGEAALKRVPQDQVKSDLRAQEAARKMMDCLKDLYLKDRPSTDPDAEQPESEPAGSGSAPAGSGTAPAGSGAGSAATGSAATGSAAATPP
jgi:hypothetical protein